MNKWTFALLAVYLSATSPAMAAITEVTGDIDVGPVRDLLKKTVACKKAETYFDVFQLVADGKRDAVGAYLEKSIAKGDCFATATSSVTVKAVKMAKVGGTERTTPSIYGVVLVSNDKFSGYVGAANLDQMGIQILQGLQQLNKKNDLPLVQ